MDGGAWRATVHRVAKSRTWLSDFTFTFTYVIVHLTVLQWGWWRPPPEGLTAHVLPPRTAAARAPVPAAHHCWLTPVQETLTLTSRSVSVSWGSLLLSLGPGAHKVLFMPSKSLWRPRGLILNAVASLLLSCCFSFALGCGVSFFGGFQHYPVDDCLAGNCSFGVLAGEDECISCKWLICSLYYVFAFVDFLVLVLGFPSFFFFWLHHIACQILVPQPGIESGPSVVKVPSPNH